MALVVGIDQVDRRNARTQERSVVVDERRPNRRWEVADCPYPAGARPQLRPEVPRGVPLTRQPESLVADVVEQDHRGGSGRVRLCIGARAAQAAVVEVRALLRQPERWLLTVEEDEADLAPARLQLHLPQRPR